MIFLVLSSSHEEIQKTSASSKNKMLPEDLHLLMAVFSPQPGVATDETQFNHDLNAELERSYTYMGNLSNYVDTLATVLSQKGFPTVSNANKAVASVRLNAMAGVATVPPGF